MHMNQRLQIDSYDRKRYINNATNNIKLKTCDTPLYLLKILTYNKYINRNVTCTSIATIRFMVQVHKHLYFVTWSLSQNDNEK